MKNSIVEMPLRVLQSNCEVTDKDMELINQHSLRELSRDEVFIYEGSCSSDVLDSYDTRMDPHTTLRNFAQDLKNGTALMEGHNTRINPYGRSFDSEITEKEDVVNVRGRWYIPRATVINGTNTDDTIRAIETGVIKDMSVGFGGADMWYKCSVDGKDLYETSYFPGDIDEDGNRVFFWIVDAHLREVSTVYKGACPGAYIEKARNEADNGTIEKEVIQKLEDRYHTRILNDDERGAFFNTKNRKDSEMMVTIEAIKTALEKGEMSRSDVENMLKEKGTRFMSNEDQAIRNELGDSASIEGVKALKRDAGYGKQYREDLIEEAVKERVVVQGDSFNAESYKRMLENSNDIEFIKDEAESYRKLKAEKFSGGRQVENENINDDDVVIVD